MHINHFQVENFKILTSVRASFHPKRNFILGHNGFGKTTLLEAIYTLFTSYSFSRQSDKELLSQESDYYNLNGSVQKDKVEYDLFVRYEKKINKKRYLLDGKKIPQYKILLENFPIAFFTPFDIQNILGEPQYRRLFFDRMISYLNPNYYQWLKEYQKILKEKNHLLKQQDYQLLDLWNDRLLGLAHKIIQERLKYIQHFNNIHQQKYFVQPEFLSSIVWKYKGACTLEDLNLLMQSKLMDEKRRQISLWGPHRDDFLILDSITGKQVRQRFSLGQIKWMSFYLKLLEIYLMNQELATLPPFLVDDAFSELDSTNQAILLGVLQDLPNQIFSTSSQDNLEFFKKDEEQVFFFKEKGRLVSKIE